jgi:uncharacterized membrane protein
MSKRWLGPVVVAAMLAFALAVYPSLPERVPTHWGLSGEPDDWMPKFPGAFLPAAIAAGVWLLLIGLRRIDPRRAHYEKFEETFWLLVNLLVLFMALGNYLPRVRSNWWMGIRTPWTLESERVWRETHRVAGWSFVFGGVVTMVAALLPPAARPWVALAGLVVAGFVPVVYSYVLYRRERSGRPA